MAALRYRYMNPLRLLKHRSWPHSPAIAPRLDKNQPVEEELTPYYDPSRFYPAQLSDVLNGRYQLATKLGHGTSSTVWLARDLNQWLWLKEKYVTVKVNASIDHALSNTGQSELDILDRISTSNPRHKGWHFIRHLVDSFTLERAGGHGTHLCLVSVPLREPLWLYQDRFVNDVLPSNMLKIILQMVLHGLDYLHSECRVIHADLKPDNIMVKLENESILSDSARDEYYHPLAQKFCEDGRTIYLSRNNYGTPRGPIGVIRITDFDCAVRGDQPNSGCIQAEVYRAPEVIIDAGYSYSADIWSLGVILWDLLEGNMLFPFGDSTGEDEIKHLAHITALLGPPPQELIGCGRRSSKFYEPDGSLKIPGPDIVPATFSFNTVINRIHGKDKQMFIEFVKRMIKWRPEERSTAKELLDDPWLHADFP